MAGLPFLQRCRTFTCYAGFAYGEHLTVAFGWFWIAHTHAKPLHLPGLRLPPCPDYTPPSLLPLHALPRTFTTLPLPYTTFTAAVTCCYTRVCTPRARIPTPTPSTCIACLYCAFTLPRSPHRVLYAVLLVGLVTPRTAPFCICLRVRTLRLYAHSLVARLRLHTRRAPATYVYALPSARTRCTYAFHHVRLRWLYHALHHAQFTTCYRLLPCLPHAPLLPTRSRCCAGARVTYRTLPRYLLPSLYTGSVRLLLVALPHATRGSGYPALVTFAAPLLTRAFPAGHSRLCVLPACHHTTTYHLHLLVRAFFCRAHHICTVYPVCSVRVARYALYLAACRYHRLPVRLPLLRLPFLPDIPAPLRDVPDATFTPVAFATGCLRFGSLP